MAWRCRMSDAGDDWPDDAQIGDLWYADFTGERHPENLSADYTANRQPRGVLPLWVMLPGGPMCLDLRYNSPHGWTVTGEPPAITVTPSINVIGEWHGFITNGVISDDLEGRTRA